MLPSISTSNLLTAAFTPMESPVNFYLLEGGVLALIGVVFLLMSFSRSENPVTAWRLYQENIILSLVWMTVGNGYFQMHLKGDCYVSAWNVGYIQFQWWLGAMVFLTLALYLVIGCICAVRLPHMPEPILPFFTGVNWCMCAAQFTLTVILAYNNYRATGKSWHFLFAAFMLLSMVDGLIFYHYFAPRHAESFKRLADEVKRQQSLSGKGDASDPSVTAPLLSPTFHAEDGAAGHNKV